MSNSRCGLKKVSFLFLGALGLTALGVTGCNHKCSTPEKRAEWVTGKIAKKLDLNDSQKSKLDEVKREYLAGREEFRRDRFDAIDALISEVKQPQVDQAKLKSIFEKRKAVVETLAPRVIAKIAEFHATLSPEQRAKVALHLEEFKEHVK